MTITVNLTPEVQEYFKYVPSDMYDTVINKLITDSLQKRTEPAESAVVPTLESMREMFESVLSNISVSASNTPVYIQSPVQETVTEVKGLEPVASSISYVSDDADYTNVDDDDDDDIWK